MNDLMRVEILGVLIDGVTKKEAFLTVATYLGGVAGRAVFTPNPEMLVLARRDKEFLKVLGSADLAIPDGTGLLWAARRQGTPIPERVTGTDLMQDIVALAAAAGRSIFLLGGAPGVAEKAAAELKRRYPDLIVVGAMSGGRVHHDADGRPIVDHDVIAAIRSSAPAVLFVAFGHGNQEKWIRQNLSSVPSVRLAMGVGGAFDFIIGRATRAPRSWQKIGLEWLWRLIREPRRLGRIWRAVVVFPFLILTSKR
jgi:N-acetylglucosaminyldiphosphoundecaprenol N-acetyl-beta-D-mannosaminyltransferase